MKNFSNRPFLALALGAFALSGVAHAQNDLRARTQNRVSTLFTFAQTRARDLNLSTKQKNQLAQIAQKNASSTKQIWNDSRITPTQRAQLLRSVRDQSLAVLTPVQRKKVDETKTQATMRLLETALWVSNELELSETQRNRVVSIVSRQMRGQGAGIGALRSSIVQTNAQIGAVLTPAQRRKWATIQGVARSEFIKRGREWRASERALGL